jgi:glycerol-3-phosphate dehydrogenase
MKPKNKLLLGLIRELGLKDNQQISEDDLCTVVKALYPKEYQTKLEALLNSKYLKAYYTDDLYTRV